MNACVKSLKMSGNGAINNTSRCVAMWRPSVTRQFDQKVAQSFQKVAQNVAQGIQFWYVWATQLVPKCMAKMSKCTKECREKRYWASKKVLIFQKKSFKSKFFENFSNLSLAIWRRSHFLGLPFWKKLASSHKKWRNFARCRHTVNDATFF